MKTAKFVVAVVAALSTTAAAAITDSHVTRAEWITILLAGLGAIGVYLVPNNEAPPA